MQSNILLVWQGQCPRHSRVWPVLLLPFCGEAGKLKELVTHISYIFLRKGNYFAGRKEGWVFERLSLVSLEKAMAPHSRALAWKIPWMEEPGRLQSMGLLGVGHDWATLLSPFHFHALEKELATHSSVLAWRIPGMGEPGGLPSMGSHRVRHGWNDLAAAAAAALLSYRIAYDQRHFEQRRGINGAPPLQTVSLKDRRDFVQSPEQMHRERGRSSDWIHDPKKEEHSDTARF